MGNQNLNKAITTATVVIALSAAVQAYFSFIQISQIKFTKLIEVLPLIIAGVFLVLIFGLAVNSYVQLRKADK